MFCVPSAGGDIGRFQGVLRHRLGVEPYPHGVVAAEHLHVAHALDAREARLDIDFQIIVDEVLIEPVVGAVKGDEFQNAGLLFRHIDANLRHLGGSSPSASATRFLMFTVAMSGSVP